MADKLSALALREVGSYGDVKDAVVERLLDKYSPAIAKQAAAKERASLLAKLGAQTIEDASQLAQIRAERDARPTASEEAKHGRYRFYQGVAAGLLTGLAATSALMLFVVARMNEQTRASTEAGVMIGTAATAQNGEPLVSPNYNRDYPRAPREPGDAP